MVDISNFVSTSQEEWKKRLGSNREQGAFLITNKPQLLKANYDWTGSVETVLEESDATVVTNYIESATRKPQDYSKEIEEVNTARTELGLEAIENAEGIGRDEQMAWITDLIEGPTLGSAYTVQYKNVTEEITVPATEDNAERQETTTRLEIEILNNEGSLVYSNSSAEIDIRNDKKATNFGAYLNEWASVNSMSVDVVAKTLADPKGALAEFDRIKKEKARVIGLREAYGSNHDSNITNAFDQIEYAVEAKSVETLEVPDGITQEQRDSYREAFCAGTIVTELFAGQTEENISSLVELARRVVVSNFATVNESYTTVKDAYKAQSELEDQLTEISTKLSDTIKEESAPVEPISSAEASTDSSEGANDAASQSGDATIENESQQKAAEERKKSIIEALKSKLEIVNNAKALKRDVNEFREKIQAIDEYADFIKKSSDPETTTLNWVKSLLDVRRAITKPAIALALAALTSGAAAIATVASSALYSVSIALSAYAAGRYASIYRIAKRHDVAVTDLHTNALHYTSRAEMAALIVPTLASIAAPFALATSAASQVLSYCGTVAMRAVYSLVASVTVNALEVSRDTANSPVPADPNVWRSTATSDARNADSLSAPVLKKLNATFSGSKFTKVEMPKNETGEEVNLPEDISNMNSLVEKANTGKLEVSDMATIKKSVSINIKNDAYSGIAKLSELQGLITRIHSTALQLTAEEKARSDADEVNTKQRTAFVGVGQ